MSIVRAYLDIETTGCSRHSHDITVIGIAIERDESMDVVQLVGRDITETALSRTLDNVEMLYTYNGHRFDLPFIRHAVGVDIERRIRCRDLMIDCWKNKLKGGLKAVEKTLGIGRQTQGIDGWMAVRLWWDYVNNHNAAAMETLLLYNREDVVNLQTLRLKLGVE